MREMIQTTGFFIRTGVANIRGMSHLITRKRHVHSAVPLRMFTPAQPAETEAMCGTWAVFDYGISIYVLSDKVKCFLL